jgi:mRNA interferase MazF
MRESWVSLDEQMEKFAQTGLKKTSVLKTEKITVIHQSLIRKQIGSLPAAILEQVRRVLLKTLEIT